MSSVRIIAGEFRGRLLRFPEETGLRPTPDRVRETLFNWMGQRLDGLSCLDLFAGSGALGFEAASRGAAHVLMVEKNRKVIDALKKNAEILKTGMKIEIVCADAVKFVSSLRLSKKRFDVIFIDPPFNQGWIERIEPDLLHLLKADGSLYIESGRRLKAYDGMQMVREGQAGQVYYHLMQRGEQHDAG